MAVNDDSRRDSPSTEKSKPVSIGRIDRAHVAVSTPPEEGSRREDGNVLQLVQQVKNQAGQLARHLSEKQDDLDQREAVLNSRLAELDSQARKARLWFEERRVELAEQQAVQPTESAVATVDDTGDANRSQEFSREREHEAQNWQRREEAMRKSLTDLSKRYAERRAALDEVTEKLRHAQTELKAVEVTHDEAQERLGAQRESEAARQISEQEREQWNRECQTREAALAGREADLETRLRDIATEQEQSRKQFIANEEELKRRETSLRQAQEQLDQAKSKWQAEREVWARKHQDAKQELSRQQRTAQANIKNREQELDERQVRCQELERKLKDAELDLRRQRDAWFAQRDQQERDENELRARLVRRHEEVESRAAALEKFREELVELHRSTLEIRLATEEIWADLAERVPSERLNQSLVTIREQIAEHYRFAEADLRRERQELEALSQSVREQYASLVSERSDRWTPVPNIQMPGHSSAPHLPESSRQYR